MYNIRKISLVYSLILFIFLAIPCFSSAPELNRDTIKNYSLYKVVYINGKKDILKVVSMDRDFVYVLNNFTNLVYKISYLDIQSQTLISEQNLKFKRVIILKNRKYYSGFIIYQDREKVNISINPLTDKLLSIKTTDIDDIVDYKAFHTEKGKSRLLATTFSALYPGLGQFYSDRILSGIVESSVFTLALTTSLVSYNTSENNYQLYKRSKYEDIDKYYQYTMYRKLSLTFAGIAVATYIFNLIDISINFQNRYNDLIEDKTVYIRPIFNIANIDKLKLNRSYDITFGVSFCF
jgi:hypothetical protein